MNAGLPFNRPLTSLRSRVLGWYALLLALALALVSLLLFQAASLYQQRLTEQKLREEIFDFEAALDSRPAGQSVREAVHLFLAHWPAEDEEALAVVLAGAAPAAAGPVGLEPDVRRLLAAGEPSSRMIGTETGEARVLVRPVTEAGRRLGTVVAVHLTEDDRNVLLRALAAVIGVALLAFLIASALAWITVGRLLAPLQQIARTAGAISSGDDLTRRIPETGPQDEVGQLTATFNRMLDRVEGAFRRERRFISEASHELRTPITICRGHLEVLGTNPAPDEFRESREIVVDELGRMGRIVEDMTTLARVEDPEFVHKEPVRADRFLTEVASKAIPLLDRRLQLSPLPAGAVVQADAQRLTQALINLLQNAAVHGRNGHRVDLGLVEEPRAWRFEVRDEGGGLPPGREAELFRPFARAGTSTGGRGLGLAIVRGIAEAHGGSAGVENRPGEGATFWLRVPR